MENYLTYSDSKLKYFSDDKSNKKQFSYTIDPLLSENENYLKLYEEYIKHFNERKHSKFGKFTLKILAYLFWICAIIVPFTDWLIPFGISGFLAHLYYWVGLTVAFVIIYSIISLSTKVDYTEENKDFIINGSIEACNDPKFISLYHRFSEFYDAKNIQIDISMQEAQIKLKYEYDILKKLEDKQHEFNEKVYSAKDVIDNSKKLEAIEKTNQGLQQKVDRQTQLVNFCLEHIKKIERLKEQHEIVLSHNEILEDISEINNTRSTMDANSQLFDENDVLNLKITKITMDDDMLDTYYHQSLQELKEDEIIQRINDIEDIIEATEDLEII